jgi:capsular exopolysaccharide synthesis family protein
LDAALLEAGQRGTVAAATLPSFDLDVATVLRALRCRWVPALLLGVLFASGAALVTRWFLPVKYKASVRFHIASRQPTVVFQPVDAVDFTNYQRTQVEWIKSPRVLEVALKQPEVSALAMIQEHAQPIPWIEQQLQCEFPAPEILRLNLIGTSPQEIDTLLTAITDAYLEVVGNKEKNERQAQLKRLTALRDEWQQKLSQKRTVFRAKASEAGAGDKQTLAYTHRLALDQLQEAKSSLVMFQSQLRKAEVELKIREQQKDEKAAAPLIPELDIEERIKADKDVAQLQAEQAALQKKLRNTLDRAQDDYPKVQEYRTQLSLNKKALEARRQELRPLVIKELVDLRRNNAPTTVAQLRLQILTLRELEKQLLPEIKRLSEETNVIKVSTLDLDALREDIAEIDGMAKIVANRAVAIQVEFDAPTRVTLLEKPAVSSLVDSKKQVLGTACGAFVGLALAFVVVLGRDLRTRRIFHPTQVSNALSIKVLGTLPVITNHAQGQGHMLATASLPDKYPRDLLSDSVDRARLKLLHAAREQPLRVLLITSAVPGEGKTSLASHLAISLARAGRKTLLIDADLRRPTLHRLFDLCLEPGFSAALRGEQPPWEVIRPSYVEGLEVIPAGRGDASAIRALSHDRLGVMFEQLKEVYEYILVDSAPVLAVVDAPLIARSVDGILFSVMCGVSHLPSLYRSYDEIAALGGRILGAVVSGTRDADAGYGYYAVSATTDEATSRSGTKPNEVRA